MTKPSNRSAHIFPNGVSLQARIRQINMLLDNGQPFALAKYRTSMFLMQDYNDWTYELILWQTREHKEPTTCLTMPRDIFYHLIDEFNLKEGKTEGYGTIYVPDDYFHQLRDSFEEQIAQIDRQIDAITEKIARGMADKEQIPELKQEKHVLQSERRRLAAKFVQENGIIIFNLISS